MSSDQEPPGSTPGNIDRGGGRRWPLWLLAAPAAVSIWAGWVGLGQMCGFGVVSLLPGIADRVAVNTAITLPVGMEAYAAYALGAWLSPRPLAGPARVFAKRSALVALGLGLLGQGVYHLLESFGYHRAPWPVVLFVACLPVLVLGAGATLHHLLAQTPTPTPEPEAVGVGVAGEDVPAPTELPPSQEAVGATPPTPAQPTSAPARVRAEASSLPPRPAVSTGLVKPDGRRGRGRGGGKKRSPRLLREHYLQIAQAHLTPQTTPTAAWCQQVTGCSRALSYQLAKTLAAASPTGQDNAA